MPYGLANSPAIFQSFINEILKDFLNKFVIAYIDDILIYSMSEAEHIHQVRTVLSRLLENQLYVKAEKCEFIQTSFLGYHISHQGVRMDTAKRTFRERCENVSSYVGSDLLKWFVIAGRGSGD
ncbi:Transposon Tf2-9 polyprotein [Labeo rohita]|uniref:ribonuclease H n=1 Tax=Labeo rohita TaxID=84645 RepID=A0ABQ8L6J5_LABRO|nr:Transposon Tf2-9 polyprotein [Labeo rohita]